MTSVEHQPHNAAAHGFKDHPEVVFYSDLNMTAELETAWASFAAAGDQPLFFQTLAWLRQVAAVKSSEGADRWRPCLATAWRGDRLTAIWALSLQREGLSWIVRCLDDPFGQFAGILANDPEEACQAIDAIIKSIKTENLAAGMMIENVAEGTALHRGLTAQNAKTLYSDEAIVVDFRPFAGFQDYQRTRKSKTRKNLRNARNRLTRDHAFEHDVVTGSGEIRSVMDQAFEARLDWMQEQAKTAPAFRDPSFRDLLATLTESEVSDQLIGFRLRSGVGVPISVQWGFLHGQRYYAFISAHNPNFDAYSPGRLHLGMVLEACFERGIEVVELMAPASDYKRSWTDQTRRIDDFGLAFSTSGYLYLDLWRRHGRSMARRLYRGLPHGLRRHVSELTNKSRAS